MYADQVKVKEHWYLPHFPPRPDRVLEMAMMKEWKEYMSYEDSHSGAWMTRLVANILAPIPGGLNGRTARVAATCALWCVTPVGRGFFDPLLRSSKRVEGLDSPGNLAVSAWAVENKLGQLTKNRLRMLLSNENGEPFYRHNSYPTLPDNRAVEQTLSFLVGESGRDLLRRVCQSTTGDWLPF